MRSKNVLRGLLCTAAAVLGLAGAASTASAQVVISQIYPGGGSSPTNGSTSGTNSTTPSNIVAATGTAEYIADFVELYNRSSQPVDVTGWTLQYGDPATGTLRQVNIGSNLANGTANQGRVSTLNGVIQPNSYFLVQLVTPPSFAGNRGLPFPANAGAPYNLDPAGGKLVLVRPRPTLGTGAGQALAAANIAAVASNLVSDAVAWGASAAVLEGANAPALTDNRFGLARKLGGCEDTGNNLNDFEIVTVGRTFVTQQPGTVALLQPRNSATAATSACAAQPSLRACCNDSNGACFLIVAAAAPATYTCPAGTTAVTSPTADSSVCSPSPCASSVACCIGQQ
ncbi:MAG: lamin tail domain-containing protein, partial [Phycisphaerales bacterium]|nr:lamin tail domain-containing protein [Phycisphaerales bacterium]